MFNKEGVCIAESAFMDKITGEEFKIEPGTSQVNFGSFSLTIANFYCPIEGETTAISIAGDSTGKQVKITGDGTVSGYTVEQALQFPIAHRVFQFRQETTATK